MQKPMLMLMAFTLAACGTVTRGTKQGVKFQSSPDGAEVTVVRSKKEKTRYNCTTPCELQLSRKRDFDVTFEKDGYKSVTGRLASRIGTKGGATGVAGNALLGGGVGFIVDIGTGANMQLKPDPMQATLAEIGSDEISKIFDIRIEGGGRMTAESDEETNSTTGLKRLPRPFGALGDLTDAGILLTEIQTESAAANAGLMAGDVVTAVNGLPISTMEEFQAAISDASTTQPTIMVVERKGERYEAEVLF